MLCHTSLSTCVISVTPQVAVCPPLQHLGTSLQPWALVLENTEMPFWLLGYLGGGRRQSCHCLCHRHPSVTAFCRGVLRFAHAQDHSHAAQLSPGVPMELGMEHLGSASGFCYQSGTAELTRRAPEVASTLAALLIFQECRRIDKGQ